MNLKSSYRRVLKKPFGILSGEKKALETAFSSPFSLAVGDATTLLLIEGGAVPAVGVVDFRERRRPITTTKKKKIVSGFSKTFRATNPAGTLSQTAVKAVSKAVAYAKKTGKNCLVIIDGEEDLVFLAAVLAAPFRAKLFYGQPGKGVVVLGSTSASKKKARWLVANAFG